MKRVPAGVAAILFGMALAMPGPAEAQKVRVALGDTISVETVSYIIALERAKEKGVDYEVTSFAKEDLALQAVVGGQADVGIATPYAVIQKSKAPLRGLFQVSRLVFFPVADKQYKTWKDLDGQPFTFHARGSGTEAIGNIIAKRQGIKFGQRSYVPGSENRVVAMLNGQIKASIVDLAERSGNVANGIRRVVRPTRRLGRAKVLRRFAQRRDLVRRDLVPGTLCRKRPDQPVVAVGNQ